MGLTPSFLDSADKALHQASLHLLFQLFSDSAHPSREAASLFATSSSALGLKTTALCWKYCTKYSITVTTDAMKRVTRNNHCGSSEPKYDELEFSMLDILCKWKR